MNKELRMHLSFFMKPMNVSGPAFGLGTVSFTTTLHGDLITVSVERYLCSAYPWLESVPYVYALVFVGFDGSF